MWRASPHILRMIPENTSGSVAPESDRDVGVLADDAAVVPPP